MSKDVDDKFPHTDEMAKWRSISFRIPRGGLDILPVLSCHIETVVLLSPRKPREPDGSGGEAKAI